MIVLPLYQFAVGTHGAHGEDSLCAVSIFPCCIKNMAFIVECFVVGDESRAFRLSDEMWEKMLVTGLFHGWRPLGTEISARSAKKWADVSFDGGYQCEDVFYEKIFKEDDAKGLSDALQRYLDDLFRFWGSRERAIQKGTKKRTRLLLKEGMDADLLIDANRSWSVEFIESLRDFLGQGAFTFCWDD